MFLGSAQDAVALLIYMRTRRTLYHGRLEFLDILPVLAALKKQDVDYVLVGGVAMNLHGVLRSTEDIDLFVRSTTENIDRLKKALFEVFDDESIEEIRAEDLQGAYPTVRYGPPDVEFMIDILVRLGEAFEYDDLRAEWVEVEGTWIHVATPETLFRMKRNTIRPIDHDDALRLSRAFDLEGEKT
jgi:hypothetical protein